MLQNAHSRKDSAYGKPLRAGSGGKSEPWGNQPLSDADPMIRAEEQMMQCVLELERIAQDLADAKTVREFSSDRLKRAFSVSVEEFLTAGDSGVAAEHKARAGKAYGAALHDLSQQYQAAMRVIERANALQVMHESARSILSTEKAKLSLI